MPQNKKSIILIYLFFIAIFLMVMSILINHKDYDCSDFSDRASAEKVFARHETDIYHLDGDGDGKICESINK